jgi:hypothetical protein
MKKNICLLLFLAMSQMAYSQVIKNVGRGIKKDAEWRIERKIRDKIDQGIDSLEKLPKKRKNKKEQEKAVAAQTQRSQTTLMGSSENEMPSEGEGFVTIKLSTPFTPKGLPVTISGISLKYKKWNAVTVVIRGPKEEEEVKVEVSDSGNYLFVYNKLQEEGEYTITATSSDGKANAAEKLWVTDWDQVKDETKDLVDVTGQAFRRLKERAEALQPLISPKDFAALLAKLKVSHERLDGLHQLLNSLKKAKKEIGDLLKSGKKLSLNMRDNLALLNEMITTKAAEIKSMNAIIGTASETAYFPATFYPAMNVASLGLYFQPGKPVSGYEPSELTICEYIAMVNEACAAFSTITNGWVKTLGGKIKNIILDKAVPKATEKIIHAAVPAMNSSDIGGDGGTFMAKETSKIFAAAKFDMESLTSKLGKAGIAGDVIQFATDVLMKVHCGVFKGKLSHYYTFDARNEKRETWWNYSVVSEAAIILRYPKSNNGIIKMKGRIEGNATRFEFYSDPTLNPDYNEGTAGKVETTILKDYTPFSIDYASSLHDELGFGMVARGMATPAYFLIPIDAEYNTSTEKLKLFINDAWVDYIPQIVNLQFFIQWVAGLPKLRVSKFPISKSRLTINATLKEKNEFIVKKDAKGNLFIEEEVKRHIGGETDERHHFLRVNLSIKKE